MDVPLFLLAFIAGPAVFGSFASPLEKKQISTDLDGRYIQDSIRKLTSLLDKLNELKRESDLNIETNAASELAEKGKTRASQLRHPEASNLDRSPAEKLRGGTGAKLEASEVRGTGGYKHGELGVGGTGGYKHGVGGTGGNKHEKLGVGGTGGYKHGLGGTGGYKHEELGVGGTGGYKHEELGVGGTGGYKHEELGVGGTGGYKRDKIDEKKHQLLEVLEELLEN